jgi:aquaporin Z|tara:strand:- start:106 stop:348 length:243 start_codon:yes stop_codon:yes gene_type:complete
MSSLIRKLLTETIGTFFLVLTIGLTNLWELPLGPIAVGFILMAMVYMGMSTSGAHYNPAVSIVMTLHGKLKPSAPGLINR